LATARALGVVTHTIEDEAKSLSLQLVEIDELEAKIQKNKKIIESKQQALAEKQHTLLTKIKERKTLETLLGGKVHEEKARMAKLTTKSQNLQELVDAVEKAERSKKEEKETGTNAITKHYKHNAKHALRSFDNAEGHLHLPSGKIISRYGNTSAGSAFSKGIMIETRAGAQALAPYDGEVVYAGRFRDYGRMVILRHSDNYHTLLSGMETITASPGQFVLEGEPLGAMGQNIPRLYMELRQDGKPVDPLPWFRR
jgi:septal ring factor EnvC (AmiA/AmiB activator)